MRLGVQHIGDKSSEESNCPLEPSFMSVDKQVHPKGEVNDEEGPKE